MERAPLTTGEISEYCHVTHRAVLKWIAAGKLKAYRTPGQHSRVEVKDFLDFLVHYNMPIPPEFQLNGNKKRILIVDDDLGLARAIKRVVAAEGQFEIDMAHDGFDAGRKFSEFKPDLVILDIKMPGMDGYQVCAYIRKEQGSKDVKILAMSGVVVKDAAEEMVKLGANAYLEKPFDNAALKAKIRELLNISM